ncbi:hypothetical protein COPG_00127 [Colwellia phage 9A]|uniref:Uncharacterized protein n=1 Tax=Colwellia phage 9A TaxID=765765 RepID=I3UMK8_9CAUD|nr:hypothetical protein COPG_00127 [Colwellia phage 9A]AFK66723.1 hypothetical protein COPG_00127 [Colwellia phage 9A]
MKKQSMIDIAKVCERGSSIIELTKDDKTIIIKGFVRSLFNGQWYVLIRYINKNSQSKRLLAKDASEFTGYKEVVL